MITKYVVKVDKIWKNQSELNSFTNKTPYRYQHIPIDLEEIVLKIQIPQLHLHQNVNQFELFIVARRFSVQNPAEIGLSFDSSPCSSATSMNNRSDEGQICDQHRKVEDEWEQTRFERMKNEYDEFVWENRRCEL
jgi:hypothetical protein